MRIDSNKLVLIWPLHLPDPTASLPLCSLPHRIRKEAKLPLG